MYRSQFSVSCGVRQGGILSPLLLNIYIDDLIDILIKSGYGCYVNNIFFRCILYADDIVLLSTVSGLQNMLIRIELITKIQADQTKVIQKIAIRIIYTCTNEMLYVSATFVADLPTMSDRRDQLSRKFFNSTLQPTSPLHSLLPPPRDQLPITAYEQPQNSPVSPPEEKSVSPFSRIP